ncbi:hypothetical protein L1O03_02880 [Corynebacterium uropygiale]|uniref:DUF8175 domain-containing protein n=1 Tax=Corynebacterium uropygiale TaxID=1775911 RepID=A0A9X1QPM5_9CORY|nr:hypothetical protein [Corynebacterium uropygiale]MCF4006122.1 hypothetical protein [Corynebacterium uropygiale]
MKQKNLIITLIVIVVVLVIGLAATVFLVLDQEKSTTAQGDHGLSMSKNHNCEYRTSVSNIAGDEIKVPVDTNGCLLSTALKDVDPNDTERVPDDFEYQILPEKNYYVIAVSSSDGPTRFDGDIPTGYAHTVQGAVMAMHNYMRAFSHYDLCVQVAKHDHHILDRGAPSQKDAEEQCRDAAEYRQVLNEKVRDKGLDPNLDFLSIIGYRVKNYNENSAEFEFWRKGPADGPGPRYSRVNNHMMWVDGEWVFGPVADDNIYNEDSVPKDMVRWDI